MTDFPAPARLSWWRVLFLFAAGVVDAAVLTGLVAWLAGGPAASTSPSGAVTRTIPSDARALTVTPVFGRDPNIRWHHLDHAFTITDPAKVARIAAIINGLAKFPAGAYTCGGDNGAAMRLTFKTSLGGPAVATVLAKYGGCEGIATPADPTFPFLVGYTSSGQDVQQLVLAIAGVRWLYRPDAMPPLRST